MNSDYSCHYRYNYSKLDCQYQLYYTTAQCHSHIFGYSHTNEIGQIIGNWQISVMHTNRRSHQVRFYPLNAHRLRICTYLHAWQASDCISMDPSSVGPASERAVRASERASEQGRIQMSQLVLINISVSIHTTIFFAIHSISTLNSHSHSNLDFITSNGSTLSHQSIIFVW